MTDETRQQTIEKVKWLCDALGLQFHENDWPMTTILDILVELTKRVVKNAN